MPIEASELFVGPAVVIDDKINEAGSGISKIIEQLEAVNIPLISSTTLPDVAQIRHWRNFSLIVLDWELFTDFGDAGTLPPGLSLPDTLTEGNSDELAKFIQRLLDDLYCPIFIFSSQSVDAIWNALRDRLTVNEDQLRARILVRSKGDLESTLFAELVTWVSERPAIYALRSWERGYEDAKKSLFADFQKSSVSWPRILWAASEADEVNPHFELTETISQNILHRFAPLVFDEGILTRSDGETPVDSLRQVLHDQAVIPIERLHSDVLMPGDFFFSSNGDGQIPSQVFINMTPACDLIPRDNQPEKDIRLVLVRADMIADEQLRGKGFENTLKNSEASHSQVLYLLTNTGRPYIVRFKNWVTGTWGDYQDLRQGRLLDPHVTQLQQKFGLYFQRQGLSKLPDEFYYRPS